MSGILRLESLTKGNTLKQGDKTPLKYRLFDADGDTLNIAGKPAKVRLVYPGFLTIGYEKDGLVVAQDDTVTFTIDSVIPARIYHVEIIVDDKFIFPSRADETKFTVDKSSLGAEANIIEIVGKDVLIREVKTQVDTELEPFLGEIEQAELDRQAQEEARETAEGERDTAEVQRKADHANRSAELDGKADKVVLNNVVSDNSRWIGVHGTHSFSDEDIVYITSTLSAAARIEYTLNNPIAGDMYYARIEIKPKFPNETYIRVGASDGEKYNPTAGEWSSISSSIKANTSDRVRLYHSTLSNYVSGDEIRFRNMTVINLTQTFGAGNEPSKEEMDELIKVTGYIDGEYALNNKEMLGHLMKGIREKANTDEGGINTVLGARDVKNEHIDINSVGVEQVKFLKIGTNLFNKDTISPNLQVTPNGTEDTTPNFSTSDYISVVPGQKLSTKGVRHVAFYDGLKTFTARVSDLNQEGDVITSPEKAYYMRVTYAHSYYDASTIQVNSGENLLPYEPYNVSLDSNIEVHLQGMNHAIVKSVNLFNKETVTTGGYYDTHTGEWIESSGHRSSDFIPVEYLKSYRRTNNGAIAGWDENKNFVKMPSLTNPFVVTLPNIKFVTVAVPYQQLPTYMFTLNENYPDEYTPYFVTEYKLDKHWTSERLENITKKVRDSQLELSEIHKAYDRDFTPPIELHLEDFSGYNQPYHPSVIYIPNGFAGYKYWMVQSPYPRGSVQHYRGRWEVPVVYKSTDGINWIIVANPLDDLSEENIANSDWMSDNHILYREDTNEIEVWYRLNILSTNTVTWFRKKTSDGENWTERETLMSGKRWWSPSIIWDNDNKEYRVWYMTESGLTYNTTPDGTTWGIGDVCSLDVFHDTWHTDVNYFNGEYHFLSYSRPSTNENTVDSEQIAYYVSDDGLNFTYKRILLDERDGNLLYSDGLYRACSLLDEDGKVRVYFSADTAYMQTRIGLLIADDFKDMQGIRRFEGNNVILNDGRTLNELAEEVARLRELLG